MDYEQKYKEAMERAREKYAVFEGMNTGDVLEEIFPELRESEDEGMKKELIKFLQECHNIECHNIDSGFFSRYCEIPFAQMLAWLEKQGEQKPVIAESEKWLIDETLYFLDEFQQSDRCCSENEMQNSITCRNWLKSLKERIGG